MPIPVVAVFDVGKTNKKLLLFNERYQIVFERSARFLETTDEDGDPCENLESLRLSIFDSLHEIFRRKEFEIKAINFTSYGASLIYLDPDGRPLTPLYNYLKAYPDGLAEKLYDQYGGLEEFSKVTASPALGSLNAGLQIYRLYTEKPALYAKINNIVHLPQYLSFLVSGELYSDMTSLGCHTGLWDFSKQDYHQWVKDTGISKKLAPIVQGDEVFSATFPGSAYKVGAGLHDSSSALIPYLLNFHEPFVLISTGTWSVSLNPFNESPLTDDELKKDCLLYMSYKSKPVKAARLFLGHEHEVQSKRIAAHFNTTTARFKNMDIRWDIVTKITTDKTIPTALDAYSKVDLNSFADYTEAYHALMIYLTEAQVASTRLVFCKKRVQRIFVDGGFSKNQIFMNLLAKYFGHIEVFAASMAQATAIGAALLIHEHWNTQQVPSNIIEIKYYRGVR